MKSVSIIIPVYNIEDCLDRAVASACRQTYREIEIILVDDGSADRSGELCDAWAEKDSRIRVIHKENGGLSSARNAGLDIARGDYICFLDGDDYIREDLLETAVPYLNSGIRLAAFNYCIVNGEEVKPNTLQYRKYRIASEEERLEFIVETLCRYAIGWEAWNRLFVKEIIDRYGIRFIDNRKIFAEDLCFTLCYMAHADSAVCIKDPLYYYVVRENSIMRNDLSRNNCGRFSLLSEAVYEHFRKTSCEYLQNCYPLIHWAILKPEIQRRFDICGIRNIPEDVTGDIPNLFFFQSNLQAVNSLFSLLGNMTSAMIMQEKALVDYVLYGGCFRYKILSKISSELSRRPRLFKNYCRNHREAERRIKEFRKNSKRIYFLGTEAFGNTGDHLINAATVEFFQNHFPEHSLLEVSSPEYGICRPFLLRYITDQDMIVLPGGGNWGDAYPAAENIRMDILRNWRNVPIIIFPQTIHYSDSEEGRRFLAAAKETVRNAKKLVVCARETVSFEFARKTFSAPVYLIPDIVFSKRFQRRSDRKKNKILWCIRNDRESILPLKEQEKLYTACQKLSDDVERMDLQLPYDVSPGDRQEEIAMKIDQYFSGELVITDRLHGMICAAVTGTPCLVFSNYNHKIKSSYEWIAHLPYVRFVRDADEAIAGLPDLLNMKDCEYDARPLIPYFETLKQLAAGNL